MANKFIGETSGKYWKQKNDETYVQETELVKITDLEEDTSVDDDDLLIKGNPSTGKMLRIKVANFLDGIKTKLLGSTDISSVGDGTVTGAINENAENISANKEDADNKYSQLNSALAEKVDSSNYLTGDQGSLDAGSTSADAAGQIALYVHNLLSNNGTANCIINNTNANVRNIVIGTRYGANRGRYIVMAVTATSIYTVRITDGPSYSAATVTTS